ncbi:MAG: hypothetical protein OEW17_00735 [Gemmatimonadota bacterium]|nr:hypothetical protein [Gemmatimonadota bacterium]MDH4347307.1 hypothetical protein [Gemmatimonadota bacterium]
MSIRARRLAASILLAGMACGDGGSGPSPGGAGSVDLVLTTPYTDDGGLLIAVTGAGVTGVSSSGYEISFTSPTDTGVTLLIRGDLKAGAVARLTVPDKGRLGRYRATVLQAAARGPGYQRRDPDGYEILLAAP